MFEQYIKKLNIIFKISADILGNLFIHRKETYCHLLWDSVFINFNGDVYTCCHYKPWKYGNIYNKNLSEVLKKSVLLKLYKFMSLHKCLFCSFDCTLIEELRKKVKPEDEMKTRHPGRILLLCGELCNISCIMCPQDHRSKEVLDFEAAKKNIDWSQFYEIMLQGGEILAMKDAKKLYLWLTREQNKKADLLTNGLLVNDEWADHLVNGSNVIAISVNAATKETHNHVNRGSDFFKVVDNIKKMISLKSEKKSGVQIIYKYSIVPENVHEVAEAIVFAENLGCDQISYGYDLSVPDYIKKNENLRLDLKNRITSILEKGVRIKVDKAKLKTLNLF
jgi:sulfatase maturation enzyme AslB (radical SAM superfamily)